MPDRDLSPNRRPSSGSNGSISWERDAVEWRQNGARVFDYFSFGRSVDRRALVEQRIDITLHDMPGERKGMDVEYACAVQLAEDDNFGSNLSRICVRRELLEERLHGALNKSILIGEFLVCIPHGVG